MNTFIHNNHISHRLGQGSHPRLEHFLKRAHIRTARKHKSIRWVPLEMLRRSYDEGLLNEDEYHRMMEEQYGLGNR